MKKSLIAAALAASFASGAHATPILSENFNNPSFAWGSGFWSTSDNWANTYYTQWANAINGWSFGWGAMYATNGQGDGAILLNENGPGTASHALTGLTVGSTYTLSFNLWGDNMPPHPYGLNVSVGASQILSLSGLIDQPAGYYNGSGGVLHTVNFVAGATTETLTFAQATPGWSPASPMIDNITVAAAVPEPETYAMLLAGLGLVGLARRRRQPAT